MGISVLTARPALICPGLQRLKGDGWWLWVYYLVPTAYSLYGLVASQYGDYEQYSVTNEDGVTQSVPQYLGSHFDFHHDFLGWYALAPRLFVSLMAACSMLGMQRLGQLAASPCMEAWHSLLTCCTKPYHY